MLWDSHSKMSRKAEAGRALAAGIILGSSPPRLTPSLPSPCGSQVIIEGLHASQHDHLVVNGKVQFLQHTEWKRITFHGRNPGPRQTGTPRGSPRVYPISGHVFSSFQPGSKCYKEDGGKVPFPLHSTPHSMIFGKFSCLLSILGVSRIPQVIERERGDQNFIQMPIDGGWGVMPGAPTKEIPCSCLKLKERARSLSVGDAI